MVTSSFADRRVKRARSMVSIQRSPTTLIRSHSVIRSPMVTSVQRSYSMPEVTRGKYLTEKYGHYSANRYRDYDLLDEYWHDRYYYMSPLYWPTYRYSGRRYYYTDPPYSLAWNYPGVWYPPRYRWSAADYLDPLFWSRYRNPFYDRPMGYPVRPWTYESMDVKRGIDMYRKGLLSFKALDLHWLTPSSWNRRYSDDVYVPSGFYGPRRYNYSFL